MYDDDDDEGENETKYIAKKMLQKTIMISSFFFTAMKSPLFHECYMQPVSTIQHKYDELNL